MTAAALTGLKLPFRFDPGLLKHDLDLITSDEWSPHYNEREFGGQWQGVALRSSAGSHRDILAGNAGQSDFVNTPLLERCAYFREVLSAFQCPLKSVRLLSLAPGSFIREHSDHALGYEDGEIRIHIPIETNSGVEFYVCGERLLFEEGECYYVNVNLPHRVNNRGLSSRIHLVIDAVVNDWVHQIFREKGRPIERSALPPGNLEDFRNLVLREEPLRERLRGISDRSQFIERTIALGRERGFDFHESDIDAGFRSRPTLLSHAPAGWTPVKVRLLEAEWVFTGGRRFTEPFFEDTVRACLRHPFAALFRVAAPLPPANPALRPAGFIFHMSRCGSTLVSQVLASLPRVYMISEAPPIDDVLQAPLPHAEKLDALRRIVQALGQATDYFVKFDAWHIHSLALIREAFPDTPWIFIYRDPIEVLVSHLRIPGRQTVAGAMDPAILGLTEKEAAELTRTQWCARVLANFCRRALEFRDDPNAMLINYRELPEAVTGSIARHFGLSLQPGDESLMRDAARLDAKNPSVPFESDTQRKQETGKELQLDAGVIALNALYRELERSSATA